MLKLVVRPFRSQLQGNEDKLAVGRRFHLPRGYPVPAPLWLRRRGESAPWLGGGWGYGQAHAVVLQQVHTGSWFGAREACENAFMEFRLREELIYSRIGGGCYAGISWKIRTIRQLYYQSCYDWIEIDVHAVMMPAWNALRAAWQDSGGFAGDASGLRQHCRQLAGKRIGFREIFWFDVSDFA